MKNASIDRLIEEKYRLDRVQAEMRERPPLPSRPSQVPDSESSFSRQSALRIKRVDWLVGVIAAACVSILLPMAMISATSVSPLEELILSKGQHMTLAITSISQDIYKGLLFLDENAEKKE